MTMTHRTVVIPDLPIKKVSGSHPPRARSSQTTSAPAAYATRAPNRPIKSSDQKATLIVAITVRGAPTVKFGFAPLIPPMVPALICVLMFPK